MSHPMTSLLAAGTLALLAASAGCALPPEPAQSPDAPALPDAGPDQEYELDFPDPAPGVPRYIQLTLGDDIAGSCGLVRAYFHFDSAKLTPAGATALKRVSTCLMSPALQGTHLEIIGRADTRGNAAYNADLGRQRAESVRKLLVRSGIPADRMSVSSTGEGEAVGKEKGMYSYGYDRRVDVLVTGVVHAPR